MKPSQKRKINCYHKSEILNFLKGIFESVSLYRSENNGYRKEVYNIYFNTIKEDKIGAECIEFTCCFFEDEMATEILLCTWNNGFGSRQRAIRFEYSNEGDRYNVFNRYPDGTNNYDISKKQIYYEVLEYLRIVCPDLVIKQIRDEKINSILYDLS